MNRVLEWQRISLAPYPLAACHQNNRKYNARKFLGKNKDMKSWCPYQWQKREKRINLDHTRFEKVLEKVSTFAVVSEVVREMA